LISIAQVPWRAPISRIRSISAPAAAILGVQNASPGNEKCLI
jgi:hypothetical protein